MLRVKWLDHVTIVVRDLSATRRFYVEVLGMDEVPRPNFSFVGQWFQAGSTQIHTILETDGTGLAATGVERNTRGHHFAFEINDVAAAMSRLEEFRVPLISPPKHRPDGAVQLFVQDPDGHLIELCVPPGGPRD
jgi:catechol 2,3-dioxygenase-like lactoylglutathione lyase family enzyme